MSKANPPRIRSVLLDTSFLITLLDETRPNHDTAVSYLDCWIASGITLFVSTIVVAEYHVREPIPEEVMRHLRVVPFNLDHAVLTASLVATWRSARNGSATPQTSGPRDAVKDDCKLFAQAHIAESGLLAADDMGMESLVSLLRSQGHSLGFNILPLWEPFNEMMAQNGQNGLF